MNPPQASFLGWIVVSILLRNALLRWTPVSGWLQRRAVAKANGVARPPSTARCSTPASPSPAAPIRRRYQLRTWLLGVLTVIIVPMAVARTVVTIGSSSPAAVIVPDFAAAVCIVALARRISQSKDKPQRGETWQKTR